MKEFCGVVVNLLLAENEEKFVGTAEVVLIYSEPRFRPTLGGLDRVREPGEYRIAFSASGMRQLSAGLVEYAELLEAMEARVNEAAAP